MPLERNEILQISTALQKNLDNSNIDVALDILKQLRDELVATDEILKSTKIGLAVGKLRKFPNRKVAEAANETVKKWKNEIEAGRPKSGSNVSASHHAVGSGSGGKPSVKDDNGIGPTAATASSSTATNTKEVRTTVTDKVEVDRSGREPVRNNCIKLIYNALAIDADGSVVSSLLLSKAEAIEACIYRKFENKLDGPYKQKMRSLYLNLKGTNVSLRADVRTSQLLPETLCAMTPEDMASDERKAQNKKLEEEGIFAAMAAVASKASTDMFKCSKCGKSETTYYQMQTRSADEPMTTFITCVNCGKKWKM